VLTKDRVYIATMKGNVIALDRASGQEIWRFKASGAIPSITLLDDGHLFAAGLGKKVYILDTANGNKLNEFAADDWVLNTPAFKDGTVYFGDFSGNVYALDITSNSGTAKWVYEGGAKVKAGP
jgi:outer membrane protein assembly factor BamB